MMKIAPATALMIGGLLAALATGVSGLTQSAHVLASLGDATWGPAPPMLPPGAQIAVLAGDPTKPVAYVARLKFPANYTIPAHSHPTDENVTVVSGDLFVGMGNAVDRGSATGLGVGGFGLLPAQMNHFAFTKQDTTVVLFGRGPVEFKYVNAADDPRHATGTTSRK